MNFDLITIEEVSPDDLNKIFELSAKFKEERSFHKSRPLEGKSIGLIFSKSSTRTRVSFEVGIRELGGYSMFLDQSKLQLGRGETIPDTAKVLSRYLHTVIIRTHEHADIVEFAKHSHIPVINALTNDYHPCQVLTDLFTIYEFSEELKNIKVTFLGDGCSNMANSWILAAKLTGIDLTIAAPEEYRPRHDIIDKEVGFGKKIRWEKDPAKAVDGANYLYTDVWVSMGFENDAKQRLSMLEPYQLNSNLLSLAANDAKVMHCLPAHRGEEITSDVLDSHQSVVFDQAENRLHVQKAILSLIIGCEEENEVG